MHRQRHTLHDFHNFAYAKSNRRVNRLRENTLWQKTISFSTLRRRNCRQLILIVNSIKFIIAGAHSLEWVNRSGSNMHAYALYSGVSARLPSAINVRVSIHGTVRTTSYKVYTCPQNNNRHGNSMRYACRPPTGAQIEFNLIRCFSVFCFCFMCVAKNTTRGARVPWRSPVRKYCLRNSTVCSSVLLQFHVHCFAQTNYNWHRAHSARVYLHIRAVWDSLESKTIARFA